MIFGKLCYTSNRNILGYKRHHKIYWNIMLRVDRPGRPKADMWPDAVATWDCMAPERI